ncbi:mannitol dehydrogenase family protein [Aureimonas sp. AU4]|uniref:mannitol dehydrogenase family protein n=1 Tax=Aureimonas sp. AU4 TaxID=1638163 RepID=UPI000780D10F|nr:mannitol dehydrogenase family protein [Aureimonas sp. AU4]
MSGLVPRLSPQTLAGLPSSVRRPGFDRARLEAGMAHIGVGAFHRAHQGDFTDDMLEQRLERWGVVGINIRSPRIEPALAPQDGLYTRLLRHGETSEARVIGSLLRVVDAVEAPGAALDVLASDAVEVVTVTVTEKGYCHHPATGELDWNSPDIRHDLADPGRPVSLPGLLARALDLRRETHGRPLTVLSCDNIPSNGRILGDAVRALAGWRSPALGDWIARHAAFPSTMVDRIAPAVTEADRQAVADAFGYRDEALAVGEPFRQWVIEDRFAGRRPDWDLAGASFVGDVEPFEHLKMRVLNGAQTTLSYLGVLAGHEHTSDDMADPLLAGFVHRMLVEETLPTLEPVPGMDSAAYVEESLARLRNRTIRHRNHQIATDGSQKIVQRLLQPVRERLGRGESVAFLSVAVAGWMAYLLRASPRFGRQWEASDPFRDQLAVIAERAGDDPGELSGAILAIPAIFGHDLRHSDKFRASTRDALAGFLSGDPLAVVRRALEPGPA